MRIVSLLPSATEMICALGLRDHLVGVSHECDYPPSVMQLPKLSSTRMPANLASDVVDALVRDSVKSGKSLYNLDVEALAGLNPDWIITQGLCSVCAISEEDVQNAVKTIPHPVRVFNLSPRTMEEVFEALQSLGLALGEKEQSVRVVDGLRQRVARVVEDSRKLPHRPRVLFLEWLNPPFSCGHWNPDLVWLAGGEDCFGQSSQPSRTLSREEVLASDPEVIFIACCGLDANRARADWSSGGWAGFLSDARAVKTGRVYFADGSQYFNRPGPRLVDSLEWLGGILHSIAANAGSGSLT